MTSVLLPARWRALALETMTSSREAILRRGSYRVSGSGQKRLETVVVVRCLCQRDAIGIDALAAGVRAAL